MIRPATIVAAAGLAAGCASPERHGHHFWNDFEIHSNGVHPAVTGLPLRRLEHTLGPDFTISSPIEGGGMEGWMEVATREGELLYFVKTGGDGRITSLRIIDPRFTTAEGIGVGAPLEEASRAYGAPVFSRAAGGTETVMFPALNGRGLALLVAPPRGASSCGDYRRAERAADGSFVTTRARQGCRVRAVEVSAR